MPFPLSLMILAVFSPFAAWIKQNISATIGFTITRLTADDIDGSTNCGGNCKNFPLDFVLSDYIYWIQLIGNENGTVQMKWWNFFFLSSLSIITSRLVICNADWIRDRKKDSAYYKRNTHIPMGSININSIIINTIHWPNGYRIIIPICQQRWADTYRHKSVNSMDQSTHEWFNLIYTFIHSFRGVEKKITNRLLLWIDKRPKSN